MRSTIVRATGKPTVVLAPSGELDLAASTCLRAAVVEACNEGLPVVVDLTDVTYLDSAALAVLVAAHRLLQADGCHLTLRGASSRVQRVLEITGLRRLFDVDDGRPLGT